MVRTRLWTDVMSLNGRTVSDVYGWRAVWWNIHFLLGSGGIFAGAYAVAFFALAARGAAIALELETFALPDVSILLAFAIDAHL